MFNWVLQIPVAKNWHHPISSWKLHESCTFFSRREFSWRLTCRWWVGYTYTYYIFQKYVIIITYIYTHLYNMRLASNKHLEF